MARHDILWTPEMLADARDDARLRILDVRAGEEYANGHIAGARHFNLYGLNTYDTDAAPLRSFLRMWVFLLGRCGVSRSDRVVFYEEISGMSAARGFWFLEYLGHEDVHILDGGLRAWREAGYALTHQAEPPTPVVYEPAEKSERLATYRDVLAAIDDPSKRIWDTRGDGEWYGTERRAARGGTIPSAVHLEWTHLLSPEGRFKSPRDTEKLLTRKGITREHEILAFCNTGYRSAHAYVALRLLDYLRARNYIGSWQEWGNRHELPVVIPERDDRAPTTT